MRKLCQIIKRISPILLMISFVLLFPAEPVRAEQTGNVYDDAELLTGNERQSLAEHIGSFMEASDWNVYAVTTDDAQGKTARAYADDFFDAHSPEKEDGVLLLIDMDNREIWISTCGIAIRYLTDERIDRILDDAYEYVSDGDYGGCFWTMFSGIEAAYEDGIPAGQYNYDEETGEKSYYRSITSTEALVVSAIALIVGVIVYSSILLAYRLKLGAYSYDPHRYGKTLLRQREDNFINQTVTQRRIQTSSGGHSSSSGRSSTHRSSSGRSHGGGGRRF